MLWTKKELKRLKYSRNISKSKKAKSAGRKRKKFFTPEYVTYLRSDKWRRKRKYLIKLCGGQCEKCGSTSNLEAHHLHYRTLGRESMQDLKLLCKSCHKQEHGL